MKQLIQYLLENLILDFQGDLTLDMVRDFLRDDDSREGRALLAKLVEDRGVSDMMITLADCLQDYLEVRHQRRDACASRSGPTPSRRMPLTQPCCSSLQGCSSLPPVPPSNAVAVRESGADAAIGRR